MKKFLKKLRKIPKTDLIIGGLFIIVSIGSIIAFKWKSLIVIPILMLLIFIYFNIDKIVLLIKKEKKNIAKKKKAEDDLEDEFQESDILNDETKNLEILAERKEGDNVKKISKRKGTTKKKISLPVKGKNNTKKKTNQKDKRPTWKKVLSVLLIAAIACVMLAAVFMIYIVVSAGTFDPDKLANQDQTVVYDANGEVIATLGREKRETITYDQLPQVLVDAIIATEDSRFFQHNGVDMARFLKASAGQLLRRNGAGGASTLTMQVVKNNLTSTESSGIKGIIRKFKDMYLSVFFVEKKYTKEEILEFYVNDSLLGGNVYGVEEASQYYFGKSVSELTLPEATMIAGMFQSPNGYNPYNYPEAATKRRNTVLKLMVRHGYITQAEADMANATDITSLLSSSKTTTGYQGYIDTVTSEVLEKTGDDPYLVSMKIYTTMNKTMQDGIDSVLNGTGYSGWENDKVQAAVAVTDVNTGAIVAIGAGRNRNGERTYNYATMAKRQPGSTSKPLFDYGPGFEYNNFSTYTLFMDEPWTYTNGPSINNWDGGYLGLVTLREALSVSRNVPALKALQQVNKKNIVKFVNSLGLEACYTKDDEYCKKLNANEREAHVINEAWAIGGGAGFTPLQMAVAYATFANGGYYIEPYSVTKIEYRGTNEVKEFKYKKERAISDSTAYLMNNSLKYAADYGFSGGARNGGTIAAKTGTTNISSETAAQLGIPSSASTDLWTVAYTPEYSVSLWYGYEKLTSETYLSGASAPKDAVMSAIIQYIPASTTQWTLPDSVVESQVEVDSWPAQLPSAYTPSNMVRTEYFIKGTEPTEESQRFAQLSDVTNLKADTSNSSSGQIKLSWASTTPEVITQKYLKNFFSQSVWGNTGMTRYYPDRISYNTNTLGDYGFGIYVKNSNGSLQEVGFTTNNNYTYYATGFSGTQNVTLVVKAEYRNFKANASSGVSKSVSAKGTNLSLNIGSSTASFNHGSYSHSDPTVLYNGRDVSSLATIHYVMNGVTYYSASTFTNAVNKLSAGTYTVTYQVSYLGSSTTATKTLIIN